MALHAVFYPSETVEPEFAKGNTIGVLKVRFQEIKGDFSGLPRRDSYGVGVGVRFPVRLENAGGCGRVNVGMAIVQAHVNTNLRSC